MPSIGLDEISSLEQTATGLNQHGGVIAEIKGLIRVYKDGHVERSQMIRCVTPALSDDLYVISKDVMIDKLSNVWARFYVPKSHGRLKLSLLVYFHGGGFSVGSASWSCYHQFLAKLSAETGCLIMSVNYRLAPENPLPAAYEDGLKALLWLKQEALNGSNQWWSNHCDFNKIFLIGDSAGANIVHHVATNLDFVLKGTILIQPFFGGEGRTNSEKYMVQPPNSALSLAASDTYWRLALPAGTNRDHPWCNPLAKGLGKLEELRVLPTMVFISEMDILRDRNLEFCYDLVKAGKRVEHVVFSGVGHAFQILGKSQLSQVRAYQMMDHIKEFISR